MSWILPSRSPGLGKASHGEKTRRKVPAHRAAVALFALFSAFRFASFAPLMSSFGLPSAGSVGSHSSQNVSPYGLLLCSLPRKSPICLVPSQRPLACVQHFSIFLRASCMLDLKASIPIRILAWIGTSLGLLLWNCLTDAKTEKMQTLAIIDQIRTGS